MRLLIISGPKINWQRATSRSLLSNFQSSRRYVSIIYSSYFSFSFAIVELNDFPSAFMIEFGDFPMAELDGDSSGKVYLRGDI